MQEWMQFVKPDQSELRPLTPDDGERGLELIEKAILDNPGDMNLRDGKYLMLLSLGRLEEGWKEYPWHLTQKTQVNYDTFPVRRWRGEDISGKHILTWVEHGIGDQIFQAGMFNELVAAVGDNGSVTILCAPRLEPLFTRSFPKAYTHRAGKVPSERLVNWQFDFQMSIADLGSLFRRDLYFKQAPFIVPDLEKVNYFRDRYKRFGRRVVGISWWSGHDRCGEAKSTTLQELAPVLATDNTFVSLQCGENRQEIAEAEDAIGCTIINDLAFNQLTDIDSFSAQVAACDYVVTTSNTTAHVAGSMGIPGCVMLPRDDIGRFWYWHAERTDSPWYPSLTLLRQGSRGDWSAPILEASNLLQSAVQYAA